VYSINSYVDVILAVLAISKVGQSFRVTIPKEVRELLELEEGDELLFFKTRGWVKHICIRKSYTHAEKE
jgi:AbrB family looped-hinge helix DNA binding protein